MNRCVKFISILTIIIVSLALAFLSFCFIYNAVVSMSHEDEGVFGIDEEKCYFVDYHVEGNRIEFRYAICYINTTDFACTASKFIVTGFDKREIDGWLANEDTFTGYYKEHTEDICVPSGEERTVIYTFEGEYLGGEVNTDMKLPWPIVYSSNICRNESHPH